MQQGQEQSTFEIRQRAVQAVQRGLTVSTVAQAYGVTRATIHRWLARYATDQEHGLERRSGSGRPRLLTELSLQDWRLLVVQPASKFGYESDLWTVRRLRQVLQDRYQVTVSADTVWRRLREAGLTYQKPERQYFEIDPATRSRWLRCEVPKIRRIVRDFKAILYFQDEAHVSLTAFLGKTWAVRGQTPKIATTGARGGVSAASALSSQGQLLFALYEKRIASAEVIAFLGQMLQHHRKRHLVVVMDQAPPHVSQRTQRYIASEPRLHVFYLPKYSPDWNPDEKVWNYLKTHELNGHQAKTKAELKRLTEEKLDGMAANGDLLQGLFFRCCVADFFG